MGRRTRMMRRRRSVPNNDDYKFQAGDGSSHAVAVARGAQNPQATSSPAWLAVIAAEEEYPVSRYRYRARFRLNNHNRNGATCSRRNRWWARK